MGDPGVRHDVRRGGAHRAETRPATHLELAGMWQAVSDAQGALGRHRLYFQATAADARLSEQLSLIPHLHEWIPISGHETVQLRALLDRYSRSVGRDASDEAARDVIRAIRLMAADRARTGSRLPSAGDLLVTPPGAAT